MKKIYLVIYSLILFILAGITGLQLHDVEAYVVTDDEGEQVDIPDKYFLKSPTEVDAEIDAVAKPLDADINTWKTNPDMTFEQIDPNIVNTFPRLANIGTFNQFVQKYSATLGVSPDFVEKYLMISADSYKTGMKYQMAGGLNDEGYSFHTAAYNSILTPSDTTVYNETGNPKIENALKLAFAQWEKDPRFHYRLVDSPQDARVIVTDSSHADGKTDKLESSYQAVFLPTIVYNQCLVQSKIILSQKITELDANDPALIHTVIHELGHASGRQDIVAD